MRGKGQTFEIMIQCILGHTHFIVVFHTYFKPIFFFFLSSKVSFLSHTDVMPQRFPEM